MLFSYLYNEAKIAVTDHVKSLASRSTTHSGSFPPVLKNKNSQLHFTVRLESSPDTII